MTAPDPNHPSLPDPERAAATALVLKLGRALHAVGTPAHRLEEAMGRVAARVGLRGQFFSTPTSVFASLGEEATERTHLIRVEPADVDLEKMERMDAVIEAVVAGRSSPRQAVEEVDRITATPPRYRGWMDLVAFAVASAGAAVFFGGGWRETAAAGGIGAAVGALSIVANRVPSVGRLFVALASFLAAFLAKALAVWAGPLSAYVVTLSGLIALVPGLTVTVAMNEIATKHLVSGTARLTGAIVVFVSMGFGVAVAERIFGLLPWSAAAVTPEGLPLYATVAALVSAPLSFTVLFRAPPRAAGWILAAGAVAFLGARAGAATLGPEMGVFVGALLVGVLGNAYARFARRPAAVPIVPGIMLLVPGSVGFRSLSSLLERNVVTGLETAFLMVFAAVALVIGLLFANVLVPPRRAL